MIKISSIRIKVLQVVFILITSFLVFFNLNILPNTFENLAMGTQTSLYQARNDNDDLIHFLHLDANEINQLESLVDESNDSVLLFLGNSQSHSINQMKQNDCNFVETVAKEIAEPSLAFTFPNANLQEFLLTFDYVLTKVAIKKVVLPVFMDDLREDGIRDIFFSELFEENHQIHNNSSVAQLINLSMKVDRESEYIHDELKPTYQDQVEKFLNNFLIENTSFWSIRETIRGNLFNFLYMLRNTIFGIRPGSIRPMISENYTRNFSALRAILDISLSKNVEVFIYIPPIRSDVPLPYSIDENEKFKLDLKLLVSNYSNVKLKDFSPIIPAEFWGYKDPTNFIDEREIDFMHFQYGGHKILADSVINWIN